PRRLPGRELVLHALGVPHHVPAARANARAGADRAGQLLGPARPAAPPRRRARARGGAVVRRDDREPRPTALATRRRARHARLRRQLALLLLGSALRPALQLTVTGSALLVACNRGGVLSRVPARRRVGRMGHTRPP